MFMGLGMPIPDLSNKPGPGRPGWGPLGTYDFQFEVTGAVTIKANAASAGNFRVSWPNGTTQVLSGNNASVAAPDGTAGIVSINNEELDTTYADEFAVVGGQTNVSKVISWGANPWSNMTNAFDGCTSLSDISTTSFISSAQGDMVTMFNGCTSLLEADIRNWNLTAGADWYGGSPFKGLVNLQKLDMTGLNVKVISRADNAFAGIGTAVTDGCEFLMSGLNMSTSTAVTTPYWFDNCKIKPTSNFSNWVFNPNGFDGTGMFRNVQLTGTNSTLNCSGWSTYSGSKFPSFMGMNSGAGDTGARANFTNLNVSNINSFQTAFQSCELSGIIGLSTWGATAGNVSMYRAFYVANYFKFDSSDNFSNTFVASLNPSNFAQAFHNCGTGLSSNFGAAPNLNNIDLSNITTLSSTFENARFYDAPDLSTATFPSTPISFNKTFKAVQTESPNPQIDFSNVSVKVSSFRETFINCEVNSVTFGNNVDFSTCTDVYRKFYQTNFPNTVNITYPTAESGLSWAALTQPLQWFTSTTGPTTGPLTTCQVDNLIRSFHNTALNSGLTVDFGLSKITEAPSVVRAQEEELVANGWTITENSTDATLPFAYPEYMVDPSSATSLTPSLLPPVADRNFTSTNSSITVDQTTGVLSWASNFEGFTTVRCTYADGCYNEVNVGVQVPTVLRRLIPAAGQTASFNLRGSQYIDWGDGTAEANSGNASHAYAAAGTGWGTWRTIKIFDKSATEKFTGFNGTSSANFDRIDIMQWGSQVFDGLSFNYFNALGLRAPSNNPVNTTLLTSFYRMFRIESGYKANARFADPNNNLGSWKTSTATGGGAITSVEEMFSGVSMLGCSLLDDHSDLTWSFPAGTTATAGTYTGTIYGRRQSGTYVDYSIRWLVKVEGSGTVTLDNNNFKAIPNYMYMGRELSVGDVIRIDAGAFGSLNNAITLTLTSDNILNVNQNPGNLNNWDTSQITNFHEMFSRSSQLGGNRRLNMNFSNWNLSNAEDISFFVGTDGNVAGLITGVNDISPKLVSAGDSPTGSSYVAWDTSNLTNIRRFNYLGSNPLGVLKYWRFNTTNNVSLAGLFYKINLQTYASDEPCKTQVILAGDSNNPYGVNYTAWNMEKVSSVSNFARRDGVNNQSITALTPALNSWQITDVLTNFNTMSYAYDGNYTFSPTVGHWDISGITGSNKWQHNRSGTFKFSTSAYDNLLDITNGWGAHASTANSGVTLNMGTSQYTGNTSPPISGTKTQTSGTNSYTVYDSTKDFVALGVQVGDIAYNITSGLYSKVTAVAGNGLSLTTDQAIWATQGDAYQLETTNAAKGRYALIEAGWTIIDSGTAPFQVQPFKFRVSVPAGTSTTITVPQCTGTSYTVNWGDGSEDNNLNTTASAVTHTYDGTVTNPEISFGKTGDTGLPTMVSFANAGSKTAVTEITQWGNLQFTNLNYQFRGCINLTTISATDLPDWSKVNDTIGMYLMFNDAPLNSVHSSMANWDVSTIRNFNQCFGDSSGLNVDLSGWNISGVDQASGLQNMFSGCSSINFDAGQWTLPTHRSDYNLSSMFQNCSSFNQDLSSWDILNRVTNLSNMFYGCTSFTATNLDQWDIRNVTDIHAIFRGCSSITNLDVSNWDTGNVTYMLRTFEGCSNFNPDVTNWDVSSVTGNHSMQEMFENSGFNRNLSGWQLNTSMSGNYEMYYIFRNSSMSTANYTDTIVGWANYVKNQNPDAPLNIDMSGQTGMTFDSNRSGGSNFNNAGAARNYLTDTVANGGAGWTISGDTVIPVTVAPFKMTFDTSTTKTITIPGSSGSWTINWGDGTTQTAQTGTVSHTYGASVTQPTIEIGHGSDSVPFTSILMNSSSSNTLLIDIPQWGDIQWSTFSNAFRGCNNSNMQISATDSPDFSQNPDTTFMFYQADLNNSDMSHWDLTGLTDTKNMFRRTSSTSGFSGTTFGDWDVSNVTYLYAMFMESSLGTQNLNSWDISNVTSISALMYITGGNPNISNWDTSSVTSMAYTFARATSFNSDLSVKTVSAGDSPTGVSYQAWNVSNVTSMENMFREATSFNQDISDWNVSNVQSLKEFIRENDVFNYDISGWNTSSLKTIKLAFYHCGAFNQNLSNWNILNFNTNSSDEAQQWAYLSNISSVNYTDTIVGWAVQVYNNSGSPSGVNASGNNKTFAGTRTSDSASGQAYSVKYSNWPSGWTTAQDAYDYLVEEANWSL